MLWKAPQEHPLREARKEVEHTAIVIMQCMSRSSRARHLNKQLKVVIGDIAIMTMILTMTDCDKKFLQMEALVDYSWFRARIS